jgi:hypothetical protein
LHGGFVSARSLWMNVTFIGIGVLSGLLLGAFVTTPARFPTVLRGCFIGCSFALGAIVALVSPPVIAAVGDSPTLLALLGTAMALAGGTSLGFIGIALHSTVAVAPEVSEVYSGGVVEWLSQVISALLTQASVCPIDFKSNAACTAAAALILCLVARYPQNHDNAVAARIASTTGERLRLAGSGLGGPLLSAAHRHES